MKQYCRYCAFCIPHRDYERAYYCTEYKKEISWAGVRRVQKCERFALSDEGDVETGKHYQERPAARAARAGGDSGTQIRIWDELEGLNACANTDINADV